MELVEEIEILNKRLLDTFSKDYITNQPNFRIVFSDDQFEKRLTDRTKDGFQLLTPVMMELPKYKQYIHSKYIIENLFVVPPSHAHELAEKTNYEPVWVFEDKDGNYLPPKWEVCLIVINSLLAARGKPAGYAKYKESIETDEMKEERIKNLEKDLFGNETRITDRLAIQEGVGYTGPNKIN